MPSISDLNPIDALSKLDMFEVTKKSEMASYSVTASDLAAFVKNTSNGGFRGSTTKSINSFTILDIGMWWWVNGESNPTGLTSGVVEIISFNPADDDNVESTFIQRLSFGEKVYQRMYVNGVPSGWGSLTNKNGAKIEYGVSTATAVTFANEFTSPPCVIVTPFNNANLSRVFEINVTSISVSSFQVQKLSSDLSAIITEIEETTDGTKTTTRTVTTQGAWAQANDIPFFWVALSDVGG